MSIKVPDCACCVGKKKWTGKQPITLYPDLEYENKKWQVPSYFVLFQKMRANELCLQVQGLVRMRSYG